MINIEVYSTHAVIRSQQPLTVGLTGASAHFAFGKPWDQLIKTAVFRQGEKTVTVADIGQQVELPWEVLTLPGVPVMIGVYGKDQEGKLVIPTLWAETEPVRPGADPQDGVTPAEPTAPVWAQLQSNMGSREQLQTNDKTSLVAAINEANRAVRAVTVSGSDGSYETRTTMAELSAAFEAGKIPLCYWEEHSIWLPLAKLDVRQTGMSFANFSLSAKNKEYYIHMTSVSGGDMKVTGSVTVLATEKSKLPNPEKLTLIGSATAEYDGSAAVSVDIPTKVSQLQNDSGFLTEAPVTSVNGQTGAVTVPTAVQVQVSQKEDGSYDYSHNSLRIMNALSAGSTVFCRLGTHYLLSLVYATPGKCIFTGVYDGDLYAVTVTSTGATVTTTPLSSGGGSGEPGKDGADGITPHIGANGNWWIGEEDTGVSAGVTDEQISGAVEEYMEENPLVKTVNGTAPDENGNVVLDIAGGGGGGGNVSRIIFDITLEESVQEFSFPLTEEDVQKILNSSTLTFHTWLLADAEDTDTTVGKISFGLYPPTEPNYDEFILQRNVNAIAPSDWKDYYDLNFVTWGLAWHGTGEKASWRASRATYPTVISTTNGSSLGSTGMDLSKLEAGYRFVVTAATKKIGAGSRLLLSV